MLEMVPEPVLAAEPCPGRVWRRAGWAGPSGAKVSLALRPYRQLSPGAWDRACRQGGAINTVLDRLVEISFKHKP